MPHKAEKIHVRDPLYYQLTSPDPENPGQRIINADGHAYKDEWGMHRFPKPTKQIDDPNFSAADALRRADKARTFSPINESAKTVRSAQGSQQQPQRGTARFVIPRPRNKANTIGGRFGQEGSLGGTGNGTGGLAI